MKPPLAAIALLLTALAGTLAGTVCPAAAQTAPTIKIALEVRSEGQPARDAAGARLHDDVRRGLEAIGDVQLVPSSVAVRIVWIVAGTGGGTAAASMIVTERYDRETLMVLGIEYDDTAARMMALQIVNDHQIFTGADGSEVARRIVAAVNGGILARLRAVRPKP
jgi:hypothetical protein